MKPIRALIVGFGASLAFVAVDGREASADAINADRPVSSQQDSAETTLLQDVFDATMVDPFVVNDPGSEQSGVALWYPGSGDSSATIVIEIAGSIGSNEMGLYSAADGTQVLLFGGAAGAGDSVTITFGAGTVDVGGGPVAFDYSEGFGFYLENPGEYIWYTEDDMNTVNDPDGMAQALVFQGQGGIQEINGIALTPTDWVIAFEDMPKIDGDGVTRRRDYQDFVFVAQNLVATPEPASLALVGLGSLGLGLMRRRSRARAAR